MNSMHMMSEDAKAILLLCGNLGGKSSEEPLTLREYNQVVSWLRGKGLRPADLLSAQANVPELARETGLDEKRLAALLARGVKLGFAVEKWNQSGIWVLCRVDSEYPVRYKKHLKEKAPPILFGTGERSLLQGGGLAIVGSRNVDEVGEAFARDLAERCAREGMPVVSGGARGVDQVAMAAALEAGGVVIGVLADTLLRRSVSYEVREALAKGRLLLLSPYHPEAGFNVGNAMGRNKLIYALADHAVVVSAEYKKGGTWEGAKEELSREGHRPVFVRLGTDVPKGNHELINLGGLPFPPLGTKDLRKTLEDALPTTPVPAASVERDSRSAKTTEPPKKIEREVALTSAHTPLTVKESVSAEPQPAQLVKSKKVLEVAPLIIDALDKPRTINELAKLLKVSKTQMQDWVKELVAEGTLIEQMKGKKKTIRKNEPGLSL